MFYFLCFGIYDVTRLWTYCLIALIETQYDMYFGNAELPT